MLLYCVCALRAPNVRHLCAIKALQSLVSYPVVHCVRIMCALCAPCVRVELVG